MDTLARPATPEQIADALLAFDPRSARFATDPYPVFAVARSAGRPLWHEGLQQWLSFSLADASATLRAKTLGRVFRPREPSELWDTFNWLHADSILDTEPPTHTRLRALVSKAFTRSYIEALRPQVVECTQSLLDAMAAKERDGGTPDLVTDLAEPLPVMIIAAMLGVPESDQHLLRPWSQDIVKMYEYDRTPEREEAARRSSGEFAAYVADLAAARHRDPGPDLITSLVQVREGTDRLDDHELIATCVLLLNAGHEASVNGFGNGMVAAFDTGQVERLRTGSADLAATAIEEFLRYDAPLQLFERTAMADTTIGGVTIPEGQKIAALLGSANRDPAVFEQADVMDLSRNPNPHIGFGAGTHFCLGAPLARLEMTTSLPMLFARFPAIRPAGEPVRRPTFVLRGYEHVPVSLAG